MKRVLIFLVLLVCLSYGAPKAVAVNTTHQPPVPQKAPTSVAVNPVDYEYDVVLNTVSNHCATVNLAGNFTTVAVVAGPHLYVTPIAPRQYSVCLHDIPPVAATYNETVTFSAGGAVSTFNATIKVFAGLVSTPASYPFDLYRDGVTSSSMCVNVWLQGVVGTLTNTHDALVTVVSATTDYRANVYTICGNYALYDYTTGVYTSLVRFTTATEEIDVSITITVHSK